MNNALRFRPALWRCAVLLSFLISGTYSFAQQGGDSTQQLLELSIEDLFNTPFVSASSKSERLFETPLSATVLTSAEIRRSGATSIPEALRLVPGLIVREQTPGNYDVHIRGFDAIDPSGFLYQTANTISLVMIDYRPVYDDAQGATPWVNLPVNIEEIERIEIIRGPAPAGMPNPASGVIHIITKAPLQRKVGINSNLTAYSTPQDYAHIASGSLGYNYNSIAATTLSASYEHRHRHHTDYWQYSRRAVPFFNPQAEQGSYVDLPTDTSRNYFGFPMKDFLRVPGDSSNIEQNYPDPDLSLNRYHLLAETQLRLSDMDMRFSGGYSYARTQRPYMDNATFLLSIEELSTRFARVLIRWKNIIASGDYAYRKQDVLGLVIGNSSRVVNSFVEYNGDILENLQLQTGLSYRHIQVNGYPYGTDTLCFIEECLKSGLPPSTNSVGSAYIRADYTMNTLRFIGAARLEKYATPNLWNLNPQCIATYTPYTDLAFRASYTRASRSPFMLTLFNFTNALFEKDSIPLGGQYLSLRTQAVTRGNTNLKLLTIDNAEIGARWKMSSQFLLDAECYSMILSNPSIHVLDSLYTDLGNFTNGKITNYQYYSYRTSDYTAHLNGATLTLTCQPMPEFRIRTFVTIQHSWLEGYNFRDPVTAKLDEHDTTFSHNATPSYYGGAELNYSPCAAWNINLSASFYGAQEFAILYDRVPVPANLLLNAAVNYELTAGIKLFVNARNVLGSGKRQFGMADKIYAFATMGLQAEL